MKVYIVFIDIESVDCVFGDKQRALDYAVTKYCWPVGEREEKEKFVWENHIKEYELL